MNGSGQSGTPPPPPPLVNYYHNRGLCCAIIIRCSQKQSPNHACDFCLGNFMEEIIACAPLDGPKFRQTLEKFINSLKVFSWLNWQSSGFDHYHHKAMGKMMFSNCTATMRVKAIRTGELPLLTSMAKLYTTKVSMPCPGKHSLIECRRCSTSTRKRVKK